MKRPAGPVLPAPADVDVAPSASARLLDAVTALAESDVPGDRLVAVLTEATRPWASCLVVRLDAPASTLMIEHACADPAAVTAAEKLTGLSLVGTRIPIARWPTTNEVLIRGRTVFVEDTHKSALATLPRIAAPVGAKVLELLDLGSESRAVHAPLRVGQRIDGCLVIWGKAVTPALMAPVAAVALRIGSATTSAARNAHDARQASDQMALLRISQSLGRVTEEAAVVDIVLREVRTVFGADAAELALADPESGRIRARRDPTGGASAPSSPALRAFRDAREVAFGDAHDAEEGGERAGLCVPVGLGEGPLGVLSIYWRRPTHTTLEERRLLAAVAREAAHAVVRCRLFETERRRRRRQQLLVEAAGEMLAELDPEQLMPSVDRAIRGVLDADRTAVFLYASDSKTVSCPHANGVSEAYVEAICDRYRDVPGGRILIDPRPQVVQDVRSDPAAEAIRPLLLAEGIAAFAVLPLMGPNAPLGAIVAYRDEALPFPDDAVAAGQTLGHIVAVALQNAHLVEAQRLRVNELAVLHGVALAATDAESEDELVDRATEIIGSALYPDNFGVLLYEENGRLRPHTSYRGIGQPAFEIDADVGVAGKVARSGQGSRLDDVRADADFLAVTPGMQSELCVPIKLGDRVLGVINAESSRAAAFSASDEHLLGTLAGQLATGIEKARLFDALRDSEERNRAIAESALEAVVSTDADGRIVAWNPAATTMFGFTEDEIRGQEVTVLLAPSVAHRARRFIGAGTVTDTDRLRRTFELPGRRKDGTTFPLEVSVAAWNSRGRQYFTGIARDISKRVQADRSLKRRAKELEFLTEQSAALRQSDSVAEMIAPVLRRCHEFAGAAGVAIFLREPSGGFSLADCYPPAPDLVGLHLDEGDGITGMVAATGESYVTSDVAEDILALLPEAASVRASGVQSVAALPLRARDQSLGVLHVAMPRGRHLGEAELRLLTAVADMTGIAINRARVVETLEERVTQRTSALNAANEQLTELDRLKSKFVADVSHELRTPVSNLRLYLHLVEKGSPEKRSRYLGVLQDQTHRLASLIDDILDLGRLDLAGGEVHYGPVDFNSVVEQVIAEHGPRARAKGIALQFTPAPDLPFVRSDTGQLTQIASNLVANAINYTAEGGVSVRTEEHADGIVLAVQDTGIGIDTTDLPHLFDRFYRGRSVSQQGIPGTGLGLAIVKEIVDLHGGTIQVTSEPGHGSTFRVALDRSGEASSPESASTASIESEAASDRSDAR